MPRIVKRLSAAERMAVVAAARALVGTPFKHRGRNERGIDCVGLIAVALQAVGREIADKRVYGRDPSKDGLREALCAHLGKPVSDYRVGDVLLMQWHSQPNHVALVGDYPLGGLSLIHASAQEGRVIEHRLADPWPRRIVAAWRP